jgi:hypothetical protein
MEPMETLDFKKLRKDLYSPKPGVISLVRVPRLHFLMVDGKGDPRTSITCQRAIEALYTTTYTSKFSVRTAWAKDFTVAPLEGLWWSDEMDNFALMRADEWRWTMMIALPDWITSTMVRDAIAAAGVKKPTLDLSGLRREAFAGSLAVQTMYVGPYDEEGPTVSEMHEHYLPDHRLAPHGKHHEIYLGDPRRTAPEKLRTILRQPVKRLR